jgi:lipopolysaccharide export system protein LptA
MTPHMHRHIRIPATLAALVLMTNCAFAANPAAQPQTVIDSDALDMTAGEDVNNFHFSGNVHAQGQGMLLTCDKLDVIARRLVKGKATLGKMNSVQSVTAQGNVRMEQAGRVATAGHAEVLPDKGLVILSDNPKIVDTKATVEGWRIIYNSRDRTAQVMPSPDNQLLPGQKKVRSRVTISEQAVPKLDYEQVLGSDKPGDTAPAKAQQPTAKPASSTPAQPAAKTK